MYRVIGGRPYFSRSWFTDLVMMSSELMRSPSRSKIQARTGGKLMLGVTTWRHDVALKRTYLGWVPDMLGVCAPSRRPNGSRKKYFSRRQCHELKITIHTLCLLATNLASNAARCLMSMWSLHERPGTQAPNTFQRSRPKPPRPPCFTEFVLVSPTPIVTFEPLIEPHPGIDGP